jgi:RNA polymerase sigma factor (sigma-70 family)
MTEGRSHFVRHRDGSEPPPSDAELLARCRAGGAAAWDTLVGRYERLVFTVALRNGVSREDAADITQSTFVALLDALDRIRDDERLPSWLMTVARRNAWRVRGASRREVSLDGVEDVAQEPTVDWETYLALHEALGQLGGNCRELLVALYFDPAEPSYAQLAQRFGRSIGGIGPMRGRCLDRLRSILGEETFL